MSPRTSRTKWSWGGPSGSPPARRSPSGGDGSGIDPLLPGAIALAVLYAIPYGQIPLYPLSLINTHFHEAAHALAAIATGGAVDGVVVRPDGSGVTLVRGGSAILTASAGYLGAAVWGVGLLVASARKGWARVASIGSALLVGGLTVAEGLGSPFTLVTGLALVGALVAICRSRRPAPWIGFLGIAQTANAFRSVADLFGPLRDVSDAGILAGMTGIPAPVWVVIWTAISVAASIVGLRWRARARRAAPTP
mgnify:CR=1 FL=1